jgi:hypothetical protein
MIRLSRWMSGSPMGLEPIFKKHNSYGTQTHFEYLSPYGTLTYLGVHLSPMSAMVRTQTQLRHESLVPHPHLPLYLSPWSGICTITNNSEYVISYQQQIGLSEQGSSPNMTFGTNVPPQISNKFAWYSLNTKWSYPPIEKVFHMFHTMHIGSKSNEYVFAIHT